MSDAVKKAKSEYMKEWRKKNPDKAKKIQERYWEKKATNTNND